MHYLSDISRVALQNYCEQCADKCKRICKYWNCKNGHEYRARAHFDAVFFSLIFAIFVSLFLTQCWHDMLHIFLFLSLVNSHIHEAHLRTKYMAKVYLYRWSALVSVCLCVFVRISGWIWFVEQVHVRRVSRP